MIHAPASMDWSSWRQEFPSCERAVHMNHAGIAPLPRRVAQALHRFADEAVVPDASIFVGWEARSEAVRVAVARLIGAQASEIAFVKNTAEGLSLVAAGMEWKPGDNVVVPQEEYPSNVYPWFGLRRWDVETRLVPRPHLRFGVADLAPFVDERTRLVAVSSADWQSGFRADLPAIAQFCRDRGVLFVVDGIQSVGALRMDVAASGIDCLAVGGHKWMLAPEGCGFLYVSRRVVERLHPVLLGWKSVDEPETFLPYHFEIRHDAARFEPGTLPHVGIHALGAAVDLLLEVGTAAIEARVLELTAQLAAGLRQRAATVVSPCDHDRERSGILTFRLGDTRALHARLTAAGIVTRIRLGGIRLAPHFYNDESDVARVLAVVDSL